jgi:hypothetical protein
MLTRLGGFKASIGPFFGILTPYLILAFLYSLAGVIQAFYSKLYEEELLGTVKQFTDLLTPENKANKGEVNVSHITDEHDSIQSNEVILSS